MGSVLMRKEMVVAGMLAVSLVAGAADGPPVRTGEVTELVAPKPVLVNGELRARTDIVLPARREGELAFVAEEGARVKAGTVVARIDDAELRLQREEQHVLAGRARINLDYLDGEVERLRQLRDSNLASQTQLAELASRRDMAGSDLAVAEVRIGQLDEALARTRIVAPVDGFVTDRLIEVGEFARRGDGVVRLVTPDVLEVLASVPALYAHRLDRHATLAVRAGSVSFQTTIRAVIPSVDDASQTFRVIADVPSAMAPALIDGQLAEVEVPLSRGERSLFVPRDAVVLRSEGSFVYRIDDDNVATRVVVELGGGQGDLVSVSGNLNPGDRVAVRGVERLSDGQAVSPSPS